MLALLTLVQSVRQSFIPDYKLRFSGKVFMRATFDASLVEGKIPNLPADSIHWVCKHFPSTPYMEPFAHEINSGDLRTTSLHPDLVSSERTDRLHEANGI
jgi:salicylate hydroxylase